MLEFHGEFRKYWLDIPWYALKLHFNYDPPRVTPTYGCHPWLRSFSIPVAAQLGPAGAEFSAYDEQGVPTHDKEGNALPKSAMKKLAKDRTVLKGR